MFALQASPGGQSFCVLHPQTPLTHAVPLWLVAQSTHGPPEPHAMLLVPGAHIAPAQQLPAAQPPSTSQALVQTPPMHAGVVALHAVQLRPPLPHASFAAPGWHVPPAQQPPLQRTAVLQAGEQIPMVGSHAWPTGQSAGPMQLLASAASAP